MIEVKRYSDIGLQRKVNYQDFLDDFSDKRRSSFLMRKDVLSPLCDFSEVGEQPSRTVRLNELMF